MNQNFRLSKKFWNVTRILDYQLSPKNYQYSVELPELYKKLLELY